VSGVQFPPWPFDPYQSATLGCAPLRHCIGWALFLPLCALSVQAPRTTWTELLAEDRARETLDRQLAAAGWLVQDSKAMNLYAGRGVAVHAAGDAGTGHTRPSRTTPDEASGSRPGHSPAYRGHPARRPPFPKSCRHHPLFVGGHKQVRIVEISNESTNFGSIRIVGDVILC
jgi:hypothetical protein